MKTNVRKLTVFAIMVALSTVLSMITVWRMPLGGSVTLLSMLPICMISIIYGVGYGITTAFVYAFGQLLMSIAEVIGWGLTPAALIGTVMLDYILAFTALGVSGIFRHHGTFGKLIGIVLAIILRFLCHFASGIIIFGVFCKWDSVPLYSLIYNGTFMLPEMILTVIGAFLLLSSKPIKDIIAKNN